jgi:hypothetical protein
MSLSDGDASIIVERKTGHPLLKKKRPQEACPEAAGKHARSPESGKEGPH